MIRKLAIVAAYQHHYYIDSSNILKVNGLLMKLFSGKKCLFYVLPFFTLIYVNSRNFTSEAKSKFT